MAHDLIIRNGTVHDGSGGASVAADVAVDDDRVTAIGDLGDATATREIDATGLAVTPGFVDLHTHMDAQIGWDPFMTSSSWHGVTTVLMGNCGVTFAPVAPDNRSYLAEMMESVEDIPREAILDGIPWDWETFPQYLDSVERMDPALNVVGMVGHCAVRYHVMGDRSLSDTEEPTPDELAQMRDIAAESVAGGAVGYSTSRLLGHKVPDGRCVPGTFSSIDEYLAIADGMNDAGGGLFQAVLDFDTKAGHEFELLKALADRAGDVLFSSGVGTSTSGDDMRVVDMWDAFFAETRANVGRISGICMTRPSGMLMGLYQVPPIAGKAWGALMALPSHADRLAALQDSATSADLRAEAETKGLWYDANHVYPMGVGDRPDYNMDTPKSVADRAADAGMAPGAWVIDRLIESDGQELFNVWFFNRHVEALAAFLQIDGIIPGLGDAGAHAGQICDADATTHYLSYWMRERGAVSLEKAVHQLTKKPADVLGLVDRGSLRVGSYADLNVFDPATVDFSYPEYVNDFPNGKGRLRVRSTGYAATLVNGQVVTAQGENTGNRPGRVIREFDRG